MTESSHFDYIIIGNGLAGLQLALKCSQDPFFSDKQFALIDPSDKTENDKTWSFWDRNNSQWSSIIHKSWSKAKVLNSKTTIDIDLTPYSYHSVRSLDFYNYAKSVLTSKPNFKFYTDKVVEVIDNKDIIVKTKTNTLSALHVFDSRIPEAFFTNTTNTISIIQHFKGIVIKTENDCFDDSTVTMMDYRLKDGDQTSFMYLLPFSKREALIEFTYFTENLVPESTYDSFIKTYIKAYLNIKSYEITESEMGKIPMTSFDFSKYNTKHLTKIGTAGGWVKASTGYSFQRTEEKVSTIISNIKHNRTPSHQLFKSKYRFYDKIFLKVLKDENHKGEWVFERFYGKITTETMFKFLDETSTFTEDLKVMRSLFSWTFIKAFFKTL